MSNIVEIVLLYFVKLVITLKLDNKSVKSEARYVDDVLITTYLWPHYNRHMTESTYRN